MRATATLPASEPPGCSSSEASPRSALKRAARSSSIDGDLAPSSSASSRPRWRTAAARVT
eukprot:15478354-Alexandrium_andersonii.AAC.1